MDRNGLGVGHYRDDVSSLSARRAWIEIVEFRLFASSGVVALRKESVDRNVFLTLTVRNVPVALRKESVDRNHIRHTTTALPSIVALRKESVDRNRLVVGSLITLGGRSPQGERG